VGFGPRKYAVTTSNPFYHDLSMSTATTGARPPTTTATTSPTRAWSVHDASELYEVSRWGNGYFSVNSLGHLEGAPDQGPATRHRPQAAD
jgi:arginine decarboxylase-like protein